MFGRYLLLTLTLPQAHTFSVLYFVIHVDFRVVLQRQEEKVTVYMGVPTMYSYLLAKYDGAPEQEQQEAR